nr:hypothetical protein [Candidatus Saccharibacteria bacterium]NIW78437.1 hypothetical protein [Calditrichia bacterium]
MNEETYLTKPSYQFQLRSEKPFLPAAQFANTKFDTQDTLSLKYQALSILQDLLRFHLEDADPAPLVDVDLKRLQFARQNSVHVQKDSLYLDALQSLEKSYLEHFISTEVSYQIASFYYEQGQQYQPGKSSLHKWDRKKAYEVCEKAIERFPESRGAHNCRALKSRITQKTLSISVEKVNPPDRPFRALVNFQNVRTIHLRAIPVTPEAQKEIRDNR